MQRGAWTWNPEWMLPAAHGGRIGCKLLKIGALKTNGCLEVKYVPHTHNTPTETWGYGYLA